MANSEDDDLYKQIIGNSRHDFCICYNSEDYKRVKYICKIFGDAGFNILSDREKYVVGEKFDGSRFRELLHVSRGIIIFIGPHRLGRIQKEELMEVDEYISSVEKNIQKINVEIDVRKAFINFVIYLPHELNADTQRVDKETPFDDQLGHLGVPKRFYYNRRSIDWRGGISDEDHWIGEINRAQTRQEKELRHDDDWRSQYLSNRYKMWLQGRLEEEAEDEDFIEQLISPELDRTFFFVPA